MKDGEGLRRGAAERGKFPPPTLSIYGRAVTQTAETRTHIHLRARTHTHKDARCIICPCDAASGIQSQNPPPRLPPLTSPPPPHPGEVWQSHGKWILVRKRFKAFMVLGVFQAAASPGFDGLFSRFICGFSWRLHCWGLTAGAPGHRVQFLFIKYKTLTCPAAPPLSRRTCVFLSLSLAQSPQE